MKSELKEFYEKKSLSSEKMESLLNLQKELKENSPRKRAPLFAGLIAASIALLVFIQFNGQALDQKIFSEVAYNHNKDMPPEVLTKDYELINEALDKLDFKVIKSQRLAVNYELVGARYCSIQGKIAAQLKLVDLRTKKRITVYQFIPSFDPLSSVGEIDGVKVEVWHEAGISFAVASENP